MLSPDTVATPITAAAIHAYRLREIPVTQGHREARGNDLRHQHAQQASSNRQSREQSEDGRQEDNKKPQSPLQALVNP